jgi:hypothetical protein
MLEAEETILSAVPTYADRFNEALARPGKNRSGVAKAMGVSPQAVRAIVIGETKSATAANNAAAAAYFGCDATWLAAGIGSPDWLETSTPPHLHAREQVAQYVSQVAPNIQAPTTWGDVMDREKMERWPASLTVIVPDQSLEPHVMAGDHVTFEACDDAPPKSVVILERADGTRWIRRLVVKADGQRWGATTSDAFPEFPAEKIIARATRRSSDFTGF